MDKKYANYLLEKTKDDYNRIAGKFSSTRERISEDVLMLRKYADPGDKILDLGCGNGRLSEIFRGSDIKYSGVDFSPELIKIARKKYAKEKFYLADALTLPFLDNSFDKVYTLAVLHHIPSWEMRIKFLEEAHRVLKPGGLIISTEWHLSARPQAKWLLLKYYFLKLFGFSKLDFNDIFIPFKNPETNTIIERYVHVFSIGELVKLFKKAGFKIVEKEITTRGKRVENKNILIIARK